jgi:CzcA family heavy metal efflux pump
LLSSLIKLCLQYRLAVLATVLVLLASGSIIIQNLSVDVLPNLTRPRVTIISECLGMSPEEVESRVTIPLENALNGATNVLEVRSTSDIGLSVIQVEFDWDQDIFLARQIVQERLVTAIDALPQNVQPQLAPVASLLGQIMLVGMWSTDGSTSPIELRTQADWVVGQRLRAIRGVAQVITMGGGRKQIHILIDPHQMHVYDVSLAEIETALAASNINVTGGFVDDGPQELLVRGLGRVTDPKTLEEIVIKPTERRSILLKQVARIVEGSQLQRGDALVDGTPAVVLTIQKQPNADTRELTNQILAALDDLRPSLPGDVVIQPTYQQRDFIDLGISNVASALLLGSALVVAILILFLMNAQTTLITVLAIPLSLVVTALAFSWLDLSINVMSLGGLAVGLGMLVDDAIVGVENVYRRWREQSVKSMVIDADSFVLEATKEVLPAIVISTLLIIVVFAPLLLLSGIEGRLFTPLAIAYLVSIVASTLVALTVTPVLSRLLLVRSNTSVDSARPSWLIQSLQELFAPIIRLSLNRVGFSFFTGLLLLAIILAAAGALKLKRDFLPTFDEGATQINLYSQPGTSLKTMREISQVADQSFQKLLKSETNPDAPLLNFTCKLGRAELDEHIMGVNVAEYVMTINPKTTIDRQHMIQLLTETVDDLPGIEHEIEQPIAHLISHMLSGVAAQIAIKIHGDDLDILRRKAEEVRRAIANIDGIAEPFVEQQQLVPQLRFEIDYSALATYGLTAREVTDMIETAMQGRVVSQFNDGQRFFDILVRMEDDYRLETALLDRLHVDLPSGGRTFLGALVKIQRGAGPNTINRENARRRIVIRVNTLGGDLAGTVEEIQKRITSQIVLPQGYYVTYGGQFEARRSATKQILWFSLASAIGVLAILFSAFPQTRLVIQILIAIPAAFAGGALALIISEQSMSIAAMVGFISLAGIATRNGLLLIGTYQQLANHMGFTREMVVRGSLDRLTPVLMSSLTTGLGLLPLVIGGTAPGKEMLYPVATVIVGGLISSTLCEFSIRPGMYWFSLSRSLRDNDSLLPLEIAEDQAGIGAPKAE